MLSNTKVIFYYVLLLSFKRTKDIFRKPIEIELNLLKQNSIFFWWQCILSRFRP